MAKTSDNKFYCYTLTEVEITDGQDPKYIRENVQSGNSFTTIQEAFDDFLKTEKYNKEKDGELMYQLIFDDSTHTDKKKADSKVSIGFFRDNGKVHKNIYIMIYEYNFKIIDLKTFKKNVNFSEKQK